MKASEALAKYGSQNRAAAALGIPRATFQSRLNAELARMNKPAAPTFTPPTLPSADLPVHEIIATLSRQFEVLHTAKEAETWAPVEIHDDKPIGVLWFGDPHMGDNGCRWPLLLRHIELCGRTPGLYGANIGDTTNNWPVDGKLAKKWAHQDSSISTEQRLARWFMSEAGVKWLVWLIGNHDAWNQGATVMKLMNTTGVFMQDWEARFVLRFPGGEEVKIHAAHDFKGNSMWNILHGPLKAAHMSSDADLYVCGHKHDWGISQFEIAGRHKTPTLIRCRGYKHHDDYARVHGFQSAQSGAAILTIFNVRASDPAGRILAFSDVEAGVAVLNALRRQASPTRTAVAKRPAKRRRKAPKSVQKRAA